MFAETSSYWSRASPCSLTYLAKPQRDSVGCLKLSRSCYQDIGWLLTDEACSDLSLFFPGSDMAHQARSLQKKLCGLSAVSSTMLLPLFLATFCSE